MATSRFILPLALCCVAANAQAEDWDLCPPQPALPEPRLEIGGDPAATDAVADEITSSGSTHILTGNVELAKGDNRVGGDRIEIDRAGGKALAEGNVYLRSEKSAVFTPRGEIDMNTGAFSVDRARLLYPSLHGQGGAEHVERDAAGVATLTDGHWSTCPPEDEDWELTATTLRLDPNNRQGTAWNAAVWFQGVPLIYSPWLRFPLGDARLTGFLPPSIGRSSDSGTEVTVPWYWNIAPNFDMTLTPRSLSRRGVQLQTETRWLGALGFWRLDHHNLPDDREFGDDRTLTQLIQRGRFAHGIRTDIKLAGVSDDEYFDDLDDSLSLTSRDNLESRADIYWNSALGRSRFRAQSFRTLDDTIAPQNRPYKQLPQITHRYDYGGRLLDLDLDAELVDFERDDSDTATRLRLVSGISAPLEAPGWFLRPRLALDHTSYQIERETSVGPDEIDRSLPVFSLDSGLVFERFGDRFYQTLEPRAFYVHVPEEDQDDIPIFDTSEPSFNFNRLFSERRFSGGDRVGDADRLSLALTSRLLDGGAEFLRGSIGVIHHFDDREVTLPGGAVETTELSDVAGEVALRPNDHWLARSSALWDPEEEFTRRHDSSVSFRGTGGGLANLGYRLARDTLGETNREQTDLSFAWPVTPRWTLLARHNYSLLEEREIEQLVGFEYEDCCWRARTIYREIIEDNDLGEIETDRSILFELVLKGLGGLGDAAGQTFESAILGYEDPSN